MCSIGGESLHSDLGSANLQNAGSERLESLKIGFVVDKCWPTYVGGYERRLFEIATRLAHLHEVRVFTSLPRSTRISNALFVRVSPPRSYLDRHGRRSIPHEMMFATEMLSCGGTLRTMDVVDCNATPYIHIPFLRASLLPSNARLIVTFLEAWNRYPYFAESFGLRDQALRLLVSFATKGISDFVAISEKTKRQLSAGYNIDKRRIEVIPCGVDNAFIQSCLPDGRSFDITFVGRLVPEKHVDVIIRAAAILRDRHNLSCKVLVIGEGPALGCLRSLAEKLDVRESIEFSGRVSEEQKYSLLKSSKLFVLPSEREGFSIASLEAMACGVPPLLAWDPNDPYGTLEFVRPGNNGYFFPLGSADDLAKLVSELLEDDARRRRLSQAAIETAEMYDWNRIVRAYLGYISRTDSDGL